MHSRGDSMMFKVDEENESGIIEGLALHHFSPVFCINENSALLPTIKVAVGK